MDIDIFIPCFIDQMYPQTGLNMVRVLEKLGCKVHYNPNQTCCGQPAYNAGYFPQAQQVAAKWIKEFSKEDRFIVSPSGSCTAMVRNGYTDFFEKDAALSGKCTQVQNNLYEFTEFLIEVLGVDRVEGARLDAKATYHDACGALRECGIHAGPRKLLSHVAGLELVEMKDNKDCCGFGGTFAVKFEAISVGMAEQKLENAMETGAKYIISTDSSCLLHLDAVIRQKKLPLQTLHIADVLASGW